MKSKAIILIVFFIKTLNAQMYTYSVYLNDQRLQNSFFDALRINDKGKAQHCLNNYKNNIGFYPHLMKAIILHQKKDTCYATALKKAFRQGFDVRFIQPFYGFNRIDSLKHAAWFKENYLADFNHTIIFQMDSLIKEDQRHRGYLERDKCIHPHLRDSLMQLQLPVDKSNQKFFLNYIQTKGFPTALVVGDYFSGVTPIDAYLILMHMGTEQREVQLSILNNNYQLCLKQRESWGKLQCLQFNLHNRFKDDWSEFSGLYIKKNKLETDASFFSLHVMAQITSQVPGYRLQIKVKEKELANNFITAFLMASKQVNDEIDGFTKELAKMAGLPEPRATSKEDIDVIIDAGIPASTVYYKISKP